MINRKSKYLGFIIVLFSMVPGFAFAQQSIQAQVTAVAALPAGVPKAKALQELLLQYNVQESPQLDSLVQEGLNFTSRPALAVQHVSLLLANAYRHFNHGNITASKAVLKATAGQLKKYNIKDQGIRSGMGALYVLLGDMETGLGYLKAEKTRGSTDVKALLISANAYYILKDSVTAAGNLADAGDMLDLANPDPSETGHVLCQLIIQSVRLKRFKELDKYYTQLKQQTGYTTAEEYLLARGLYSSYKKDFKPAAADFRKLTAAFVNGRQNQETLEGVIRLAALLSSSKNGAEAKKYFDIAGKAITKNMAVQPIGMVYTALYHEHLERYNNKSALDALLAKSPAKDSAFKTAVLSVLKDYKYQLNLLNRGKKIDSLEQAKQLADLKLNRDRQRNWLITVSLILMLSVAFIVIYVFYQRRKRTILLFQAEKERTENQHKQELSKLLASAQEQERSKIAEKLHDEIGSMLAVVRLNLSLPENADADLPRAQLNTANKVLNDVADTVRQMSHELMPVLIQKMGLKKAVEQLVEDINAAGQLYIECIIVGVDERPDIYDYEFKVNIYRIIQELFHNIIKHSKATNVSFQLIQHPDELNILIEDNGVGIDKGKDTSGKGMKLIAARVNSYHGEIQVERNADAGTVVVIDIPLNNSLTSLN